jgi:hypothetical protein
MNNVMNIFVIRKVSADLRTTLGICAVGALYIRRPWQLKLNVGTKDKNLF